MIGNSQVCRYEEDDGRVLVVMKDGLIGGRSDRVGVAAMRFEVRVK